VIGTAFEEDAKPKNKARGPIRMCWVVRFLGEIFLKRFMLIKAAVGGYQISMFTTITIIGDD